MLPETLQQELQEILESSFLKRALKNEETLILSETDMFHLWNILGEELGIDLSLVDQGERKLLFEHCEYGKKIKPKNFGSLLWLMYYSQRTYQ